MSDTLMTIIGIFIAVILMFILPFSIMANKNDEIAQTVVQVAVSDFVETVTNQGRITEFDYNKLVQKISTTGNAYDIQIEAQIIDDNSRRATSTADSSQTGEYKYYSVYTNTIMDKIRNDGFYELKKDDYVIVNVKNINITLGTQFKNMFYKLVGKDTYTIGTSSSGIVVNSDTNVEKAVEGAIPNKLEDEEKTIKVKAERNGIINIEEDVAMVVILDCAPDSIPYHNVHSSETGGSDQNVLDIVESIGDKGEVYFILTAIPNQVYTKEEVLLRIRGIGSNQAPTVYPKSVETAFKFIKDKNKPRCVVFVGFTPDDAATPIELNTYKDYYDCFFTMLCCEHWNGDSGKGRGEKSQKAWFSKYQKEVGGHIFGDTLGEKFNKVVDTAKWMRRTILGGEHYLREEDITTSNLKVYLSDLDITQEMTIIINNVEVKKIGSNMPEYVVYFDETKNSYVLDLKIVKEILNMSDESWKNANIEFDYTPIV